MQVLLVTLQKYEPLIYLVLAFLGLFVFRWLWRAWKEWRDSYFGLERELAMRRLAQAAAMALLVLVFACAELAVVSFVVPDLPATAVLATPTLDLLSTPLEFQVGTGTASTQAFTPVPIATLQGAEGCIPGKLEITSPKSGDTITGKIEITGTVNIPDFGFYKYEFTPLGSDIWATISADRKTIVDGTLGTWFTSSLTPGDYQLRLVATDTQGNALPPCIITVRIVGQ